jgi:hypothetical protein
VKLHVAAEADVTAKAESTNAIAAATAVTRLSETEIDMINFFNL